jgi:hypothetical protein
VVSACLAPSLTSLLLRSELIWLVGIATAFLGVHSIFYATQDEVWLVAVSCAASLTESLLQWELATAFESEV